MPLDTAPRGQGGRREQDGSRGAEPPLQGQAEWPRVWLWYSSRLSADALGTWELRPRLGSRAPTPGSAACPCPRPRSACQEPVARAPARGGEQIPPSNERRKGLWTVWKSPHCPGQMLLISKEAPGLLPSPPRGVPSATGHRLELALNLRPLHTPGSGQWSGQGRHEFLRLHNNTRKV